MSINTPKTTAKERAIIAKGSITSSNQQQQQQNQNNNNNNNDDELNQPSVRNIMGFIEKYDRAELQELLSCMSSNWLLSVDDFKLTIEHPIGVISQMAPLNDNHIMILMPYDDSIPNLDYREIHQIIRELTIGIFALNQHPNLVLDANFDESTSCTMPPAYIDTKLGQIMINTDYWLKALWHGAYFPRDRRLKFSERWRQMFDIDANGVPQTRKILLNEFITTGLHDTNKDPEYANVFDELMNEEEKVFKGMTEENIRDEKNFFMSYIDDIALQITMHMKNIKQYKNLYEIESDYYINSCIKATNEQIDHLKFERLKRRLNRQELFLRKYFAKKKEVRNNLNILKLVSFLVPLFIGLKRRMKVPDLNNLLPFMSGDDVRTERELPPLMLHPDFKCKIFDFKNTSNNNNNNNGDKYFHLHGGIQFELETVLINNQCSDEYESLYNQVFNEATDTLQRYLQSETQLQEYPVPIIEINGKKFYCLRIDIENYYSQYPQKPLWINKLTDELSKLKPKRLPLSDINIYDLFKKYFGYKKATKFKTAPIGLKASASRGLMGIFQSITRKTPAGRLAKQDENGLSLMHYAAIYNRPLVLTSLILSSVDVNIKQQIDYLAVGPMSLHYAARCTSLDSMSCLLSNYANISYADQQGWSPIHHASFFDNVPGIKLILRRQIEMIELITRGENRWTPILLAASAGSLEAIKCLMSLGANWIFTDDKGYNLIHVAAQRFHTNIIEYFINLNSQQLQATNIIINMLKSPREADQQAAVKCLQGMTTQNDFYCKQILEANGVDQLVSILRTHSTINTQNQNHAKLQQTLNLTTLSVLCNISDNQIVRECLSKIPDITSILSKLIDSTMTDDIQSRATILIADIASMKNDIRVTFAEKGCNEKLAKLLESDVEDLLVNTINAIESLCKDNELNQNHFAQMNILILLIDLLSLNSDYIKASVAAAISAIVMKNKRNQDLALEQGVIKQLINLLTTRNVTVKLKVALALESLAKDNIILQRVILELGAAEHMINLLKKMYYVGVTIKENTEDWSIVVREQAACTLWALAGSQKPQRKLIAEKIGILQIIIMLLSKSDKLQYVGCKCVIALVLENITNQKLIAKENSIEIFLTLLRNEKTSLNVVLAIVQTIAALCVDVASVNNADTQQELMEKGAFEILIPILEKPPNKDIQIETAHAIACLLLGNPKTEEYVNNKLDLKIIMELLNEKDKELRLNAGKALTILSYNNTQKQFEIKQLGGISFSIYEDIIESDDEMQVCKACFQLVVLARVINDREKVWVTATGVSKIVDLLNSIDDEVVIQTASYLASLAHTRAGITDAMIQCNIVDILCEKIYSKNEQIRFASAVTLGYLTFNRTASRLLLHNCRNRTNLFKTLMDNLRDDSKINEEFLLNYETALKLGLPKLLVHNKVRFLEPVTSSRPIRDRSQSEMETRRERIKTAHPTTNRQQSSKPITIINRAISAPNKNKKLEATVLSKTLSARPSTSKIYTD